MYSLSGRISRLSRVLLDHVGRSSRTSGRTAKHGG